MATNSPPTANALQEFLDQVNKQNNGEGFVTNANEKQEVDNEVAEKDKMEVVQQEATVQNVRKYAISIHAVI